MTSDPDHTVTIPASEYGRLVCCDIALRTLVRLKTKKDSGVTYTADEKDRAWAAAREALGND